MDGQSFSPHGEAGCEPKLVNKYKRIRGMHQ